MVLASFWFALMAVGIKFASHSFGTFELVFYRGVVSVVFMAIVVKAKGSTIRTPVPMMHVWRSFIGVLSLGSWFYAIAHLPLATAMTLNYMSGVWVAAFVVGGALLYGKQQPQGALLGTVLMGFVGRSDDAAPHHRPKPTVCWSDWPAVRLGRGAGLHASHRTGQGG